MIFKSKLCYGCYKNHFGIHVNGDDKRVHENMFTSFMEGFPKTGLMMSQKNSQAKTQEGHGKIVD